MKQRYENKLYSYTGFSEPRLFDLNEMSITSNYQGDITDYLFEELYEWEKESDEDIKYEQPFVSSYGIWFMPTKKDLQERNKYYGLRENDYLEDFEDIV